MRFMGWPRAAQNSGTLQAVLSMGSKGQVKEGIPGATKNQELPGVVKEEREGTQNSNEPVQDMKGNNSTEIIFSQF